MSSSSTNGAGTEAGQVELVDTTSEPQPRDSRSGSYLMKLQAQKLGLVAEVEGTGLPKKLTLALPVLGFATVLGMGALIALTTMVAPTTEGWDTTARLTLLGIVTLSTLMCGAAVFFPIVLVIANRIERRRPPDNHDDPARLIMRTEKIGYGVYDPLTDTYAVVQVPAQRSKRKPSKTDRARANHRKR